MYELFIFIAGAVCGGFLGYRWGRDDTPAIQGMVTTQGSGGPAVPEK